MAFDTVSDPILQVALWAGLASLGASALMLVGVLLVRLHRARRAAKERAVTQRWRPVLVRCAGGEPVAVTRLPRAEVRAFLGLWNVMQESLRGDAKAQLNTLARALEVDGLALELLAAPDLRSRLMAVLTLGNLRHRPAAPSLAELLWAASPVLSLRAAQALLRIDPPGALPQILPVAAQRVDWPVPRLISLLREAAPEAVAEALARVIEAQSNVPSGVQRLPRLFKLGEAAHPPGLRRITVKTLEGAQDAEVIAAALGALRLPDDAELARRFTRHPHWHVRLEAANALGRLGTRTDLHRLVGLLRDPNWWVRHRAAQALAALPWARPAQLERIMRAVADRFAADALKQAMAERHGT